MPPDPELVAETREWLTKAALDLIESKRVPVTDMITHRLALSEAQKGFDLVAEAKESIKVVLEPQR